MGRFYKEYHLTYNDTEIGILLQARGVFPDYIDTRSDDHKSVEFAAFKRLVEDGALDLEIEIKHTDELTYRTAVISEHGRELLV